MPSYLAIVFEPAGANSVVADELPAVPYHGNLVTTRNRLSNLVKHRLADECDAAQEVRSPDMEAIAKSTFLM
jgi:hypothetical protein